MINGHGLYFWDAVSYAARLHGNNLITLVIGLLLLAISIWLAFQWPLCGRLLLTGTLGYFLELSEVIVYIPNGPHRPFNKAGASAGRHYRVNVPEERSK